MQPRRHLLEVFAETLLDPLGLSERASPPWLADRTRRRCQCDLALDSLLARSKRPSRRRAWCWSASATRCRISNCPPVRGGGPPLSARASSALVRHLVFLGAEAYRVFEYAARRGELSVVACSRELRPPHSPRDGAGNGRQISPQQRQEQETEAERREEAEGSSRQEAGVFDIRERQVGLRCRRCRIGGWGSGGPDRSLNLPVGREPPRQRRPRPRGERTDPSPTAAYTLIFIYRSTEKRVR